MYDRFRQVIESKGITSYKIAKDTGISQNIFSYWKSGRSKPKADKLLKIANYLGVSVEELIDTEGKE